MMSGGQSLNPGDSTQTGAARIYFAGGRVEYFSDQALAFAIWLGLPKGVRVAFRGANDTTPVYPWDYVDAQ